MKKENAEKVLTSLGFYISRLNKKTYIPIIRNATDLEVHDRNLNPLCDNIIKKQGQNKDYTYQISKQAHDAYIDLTILEILSNLTRDLVGVTKVSVKNKIATISADNMENLAEIGKYFIDIDRLHCIGFNAYFRSKRLELVFGGKTKYGVFDQLVLRKNNILSELPADGHVLFLNENQQRFWDTDNEKWALVKTGRDPTEFQEFIETIKDMVTGSYVYMKKYVDIIKGKKKVIKNEQ